MAKEPVMGGVKTRLAREVGLVAATWVYRHASRALMARLAGDRRWRTMLSIAPAMGVGRPIWPRSILRVAQGHGDLGARMQAILDLRAPGPVVIVGTDIPAVLPSHIAHAFQVLRGHEAVLGPAEDGGYWLVGLRRSPRVPRPFANVRWSSPHALADTLRNLQSRRVGFAARLSDLDDQAAFRRWRGIAGRRVLPVWLTPGVPLKG